MVELLGSCFAISIYLQWAASVDGIHSSLLVDSSVESVPMSFDRLFRYNRGQNDRIEAARRW